MDYVMSLMCLFLLTYQYIYDMDQGCMMFYMTVYFLYHHYLLICSLYHTTTASMCEVVKGYSNKLDFYLVTCKI